MQSGIGLERQLTKNATVSVTYLNTHGAHQLIMRDINAPDPANPGSARPNRNISDLYQYESAGLYNQNQMIANFNIRGSKVSLFGFYTLSYVDSNTVGPGSFPMNQYDLEEDYGRAAYDVRNRLFLGGSWNLPRGISTLSLCCGQFRPSLQHHAGPGTERRYPFSMTGLPSPRISPTPPMSSAPAGASLTPCRWRERPFIPPNYGIGFGQFTANLRLSKTFGFGKEVARRGKSVEVPGRRRTPRGRPGTGRPQQHGHRAAEAQCLAEELPPTPLQPHLQHFRPQSFQ